jgi:hypothetical protein
MIPPSQQWALQIDVTNACHLHCSNCTRLLDHARRRFFMAPDCFERAVRAVKDFPAESEPCPKGRRKVVGIIGGEPLLHPEFPTLVDIMIQEIPQLYYRGLWTSKDWKTGSHPKWGPYRPQVERLIGVNPTSKIHGPSASHATGFLNWNMHLPSMNVHHQPLLAASQDLVADERERWALIEQCWVQRDWSGTCTPKGFFFCEVAGHFDLLFDGPGGKPLEPGAWRGDLYFETDAAGVRRPHGHFADQVRQWCTRCGASVPQAGRRDAENTDDVSPSNLIPLQALRSPRIARGDYVLHTDPLAPSERWNPKKYIKGPKPKDQSVAAKTEAAT